MSKFFFGVIILYSVLVNMMCADIASAGDIFVIGNRSVPADTLTDSDIKDIYLGKRKVWGNGLRVVFVKLGNNKITEKFLQQCVKKNVNTYRKYWYKKLYTGAGKEPKEFKDPKDLLQYVTQTKGAVGYINAELYDDNVKILSVIH